MVSVEELPIDGLKLITLRCFPDERGLFCERFKYSDFEGMGLPTRFVQDNFSRSNPGVLRGLHYQWDQPQGKLVTCLNGSILDVAVDIREGSPHYGKYFSIELYEDKPQWLWIPAGFAHGFCVLGTKPADVLYKCDNEYKSQGEGGILWSDLDLNIQWPSDGYSVSKKDAIQSSFQEYTKQPRFKFGQF